MVREFLALFKKDSKVLQQAAALATIPLQKQTTQAAAQVEMEKQRQIQYRPRLTYAEEQARWEWEHNKAARDAYQRQKDGFF